MAGKVTPWRKIWERTEGAFPIELHQQERSKRQCFMVIYGSQADLHLNYAAACRALGEALMHSLTCEGLVEDGED